MAKNIKSEKDVAMEGIDWTDLLARHQAAMNKQNALVKSCQQSCNYMARDDDPQFDKQAEILEAELALLKVMWSEHRRLVRQRNAELGD